jgi:signal transduction histidine kinase
VIQTIYDIIKAHGGEIKVETKEGEGSEFIIQLPLSESRLKIKSN